MPALRRQCVLDFMRSNQVDRIAEFNVQGQEFHIYPADGYHRNPETTDCRAGRVVGEVVINETKHLIVTSGNGKYNDNLPDDRNQLNILTKRELQIVVMVARGLVNKVIADRLHISEWTVSTHLRRVFAKLHVDSRAEMVYHCAKMIDSHSHIPD
jgi:DNA-binding CsgD family transcriptional regulator